MVTLVKCVQSTAIFVVGPVVLSVGSSPLRWRIRVVVLDQRGSQRRRHNEYARVEDSRRAPVSRLAPGYTVYRRPRMAEEGVPANAELV